MDSPFLYQHGGTVCSIPNYDHDIPFSQTLCNLQCTHVALPTSHLDRVCLALFEFSSMSDGTTICDDACGLPLHTLIVSDDPPTQLAESISLRGLKVIKVRLITL
jgi:hypothetical protein